MSKERRVSVSKQIVGNTGLYYVCYELSKRGWNVMPTARNTAANNRKRKVAPRGRMLVNTHTKFNRADC